MVRMTLLIIIIEIQQQRHFVVRVGYVVFDDMNVGDLDGMQVAKIRRADSAHSFKFIVLMQLSVAKEIEGR